MLLTIFSMSCPLTVLVSCSRQYHVSIITASAITCHYINRYDVQLPLQQRRFYYWLEQPIDRIFHWSSRQECSYKPYRRMGLPAIELPHSALLLCDAPASSSTTVTVHSYNARQLMLYIIAFYAPKAGQREYASTHWVRGLKICLIPVDQTFWWQKSYRAHSST